MKYTKATKLLPEYLLLEIQKYVQGETIYIPKPKDTHHKWGSQTDGRKHLQQRNVEIRQSFVAGKGIEELSKEYYLSIETIKKIVYNRKYKRNG